MSELVLVTSRGLCQVATLVWFIYDYLLSIDEEVEHIWTRKINVPSVLYISSRTLSFTMLVIGAVEATRTYSLTQRQCDIFHWLEGVGSMIVFVNTQLVLQYRLWAIYDRSMKILIMNAALFAVEAAGSITLLSIYYAKQKTANTPLPATGMTGETCLTVPQREMSLIFCTVLAYELWLVALALVRIVQVRRLVLVSGHRCITEVVAYDSLMYFILIAASVVVVIVVWDVAPLYPGNSSIAFTRAACGIGASRLILHVKSEAKARSDHTFSNVDCVGVSLVLSDSSTDNSVQARFVRKPHAASPAV